MRKQDCVVNEYRVSEYRHKSRIIINRTQQTVLNIFFPQFAVGTRRP